MKFNAKLLAIFLVFLAFIGCDEEDEANEMSITFVQENGYISMDSAMTLSDTLKVKINGKTKESDDPLIKFTISQSVNSASNETIVNNKIKSSNYNYEFVQPLSSYKSGDVIAYTFTIVNKDGYSKQSILNITIE